MNLYNIFLTSKIIYMYIYKLIDVLENEIDQKTKTKKLTASRMKKYRERKNKTVRSYHNTLIISYQYPLS